VQLIIIAVQAKSLFLAVHILKYYITGPEYDISP